jgi:hypothetical protein
VCGYIPLARLLTRALKAPTPTPTSAPTTEGQEEETKDSEKESSIGDDRAGYEHGIGDKGAVKKKHHAHEEMSEENLKESLGWT